MRLKILHLSSGFKMSRVVENLLFTYLRNRYHQQIPGIKLIQIGAISSSLWAHHELINCRAAWRHQKTSTVCTVHIYSVWCAPMLGIWPEPEPDKALPEVSTEYMDEAAKKFSTWGYTLVSLRNSWRLVQNTKIASVKTPWKPQFCLEKKKKNDPHRVVTF
jgi:hypothetical protein